MGAGLPAPGPWPGGLLHILPPSALLLPLLSRPPTISPTDLLLPLQTVFLRMYTTEAAAKIPDNSLDYVYVDAR